MDKFELLFLLTLIDFIKLMMTVVFRELMKSLSFHMFGCQTSWQTFIYRNVIGISVKLPWCEFDQTTSIENIQYNYYDWKIGNTVFIHSKYLHVSIILVVYVPIQLCTCIAAFSPEKRWNFDDIILFI